MAGSIFGLGLSQRVDLNGKPAVGWLLYLYAANSSTPVNIFQDVALTVPATWPLSADANGMMPPFWLADGSYRVRGTTEDGSVTYFDIPSVLALGASSGAAPSGGVDPNAIFQTGDVLWLDVQGTRPGFVRDNGRTIGSATSGAAERANADCQNLFTFLWTNFPDTMCPVGGGRGASANADWSANKQIATPDKRGYIAGGLDDMGNSAAGRWNSVPVVNGGVTTPGSVLGEPLHSIITSEMPAHNHTANVTDPGHTHTISSNIGQPLSSTGGFQSGTAGGVTYGTATHTAALNASNISVSTASVGGNGSHNNVQKTVLGTFFRKL